MARRGRARPHGIEANPAEQRKRLDTATADLDPPFAVLDGPAMAANADALVCLRRRQADPGRQQVGPQPGRAAHAAGPTRLAAA